MEKVRHPEWRPKPQTPEMRFGTLLEPIMRAAYSEDTGKKVGVPGEKTYWADDKIRYAHIDGLVEGQGIWEGKAPFQTWRNWHAGPPVYVHAQVQHYLDITGEPWCDVSALAAGLDPIFQTWRIHSDPETQENVRVAVLRFWQVNVRGDIPPDRLPVQYEFPRNTSDLMLVADEGAEELVAKLFSARSNKDNEEEYEAELKEELQRKIGTAAGMLGNGWRIRYKANRDSEKVDWKLVAGVYRRMLEEALPHLNDLVVTDMETAKALRLLTDTPLDSIVSLYTETRPGQRPFVLERWEPK